MVEERQGPGVRHTPASPLSWPAGTAVDKGPVPDPAFSSASGDQENTGCAGKSSGVNEMMSSGEVRKLLSHEGKKAPLRFK